VTPDRHRWPGLAIYGVDGSAVRVPDTVDNETAFGRPGTGRDQVACPQVRLVALMVPRTHLLGQLAIGAWKMSESILAEQIWRRIPDQSLTFLDGGFLSRDGRPSRPMTGGAPGSLVGGAVPGSREESPPPSSHIIVRTVPHTAVHDEHASLRYSSRKLKRPSCCSLRVGIAWFMWLAPTFHQGPRPLPAESLARSGSLSLTG